MSTDDVLAAIDGAVTDWESDSPDAMRWVPPEDREQLEHLRDAGDNEEPLFDGFLLAPGGSRVTAFIGPIGGHPSEMRRLPVVSAQLELQDDGTYTNPEPIVFEWPAARSVEMELDPEAVRRMAERFASMAGDLAGSFALLGDVVRQMGERLSELLMQALITGRDPRVIVGGSRQYGRTDLAGRILEREDQARQIAHAFEVPPEVVGLLPCPSDGLCECTTVLHHEQPLSPAERALQARRSRNTGPPQQPASRQRRPRTHR